MGNFSTMQFISLSFVARGTVSGMYFVRAANLVPCVKKFM